MNKIKDWQWEDKEVTESTNDDAVALSSHLKNIKFIISAQEQSKGRGRRGRNWISQKGNLFFSQGLEFETRFLGQLVCISSLSLYQSIEKNLPKSYQVKLKWPNDVLIDNCKVSGTLLEKGEGDYFIIGIGVNIRVAPENKNLLYPVTSLAQKGINIDRLDFLRSYIDNFDNNYQLWQESGFEKLKKKWLSAVKGIGEKVTVQTPTAVLEGVFEGIGDNGELLLKNKQEMQKIFAGDVFYIKKDD
ncbi:MAG: biotin--[Alphaproteobacteria bacterium]|nr:biotin--[acetyl-CoA-carboxylase] ligase [Alphaproteobacteria bacterium]